MALSVNLTLPEYGLTVPNAYARMRAVSFVRNKGNTRAEIALECYVDKAKSPVKIMNFLVPETITTVDDEGVSTESDNPVYTQFFSNAAFAPQGANPVKNAYAYLKTLPDFGGAVDVV